MSTELEILIHSMQDSIKRIIVEHKLDLSSLCFHITKALEETGCPSTFKLINMEEAKK